MVWVRQFDVANCAIKVAYSVSLKHETFSQNTQAQLKQVFEALRQLMAPPVEPPKRLIGFVTEGEKTGKTGE